MTYLDTAPTLADGRPRRRDLGRLVARPVLLPLAWGLAIFDLFVIGWMVLSSFKSTREMFLDPWGLPDEWMAVNYRTAWETAQLGSGIANSVILVLASGVATLAIAAPAAYALSRFGGRGASSLSVFIVIGLGIPAQAMFIPLYVMLDRIGLVDSLLGLVIVYTGLGIPYAFFLLTAFFRSLPPEIEDAAAMDGATPWSCFWRISLPLVRSGLLTVFLLQAIGHWGETFFALVLLTDQETVSLSMLRFMQSMQYTGGHWSVLFAGMSLVVLPLIVLYLWLGTRMIEGIAAGYSR